LTKNAAYNLRHNFGIGANGSGKDVVVCISSGQILLPIVLFGVIAAGGVYSAASAAFTSSELSRQVKQGNSNLIFCSEDAKDVAISAARECGVPLNRVLVMNPRKGEWGFRSAEGGQSCLGGNGMLDWERITDREKLDESLICLLYSSGTTGVPKGCGLLKPRDEDADGNQVLNFPTRIWWHNPIFLLPCGKKPSLNVQRKEDLNSNTGHSHISQQHT
jgi:4-coumarate--CoA ligase